MAAIRPTDDAETMILALYIGGAPILLAFLEAFARHSWPIYKKFARLGVELTFSSPSSPTV